MEMVAVERGRTFALMQIYYAAAENPRTQTADYYMSVKDSLEDSIWQTELLWLS